MISGSDLVHQWLFEYACRNQFSRVLHEIAAKPSAGLWSQDSCSISPVFPLLSVIRDIISKELVESYPKLIEILTIIYNETSDSVPFKIFARLVIALKVFVLFDMLKKGDKLVMPRLNEYFPRTGFHHNKADEKVEKRMNAAHLDFRKFFFGLIGNETARKYYLEKKLEEDYGADFRKRTKELVNRFCRSVEDKFPQCVIDKILSADQSSALIRGLSSLSSPSVELLLDAAHRRENLTEDDVLGVLHSLQRIANESHLSLLSAPNMDNFSVTCLADQTSNTNLSNELLNSLNGWLNGKSSSDPKESSNHVPSSEDVGDGHVESHEGVKCGTSNVELFSSDPPCVSIETPQSSGPGPDDVERSDSGELGGSGEPDSKKSTAFVETDVGKPVKNPSRTGLRKGIFPSFRNKKVQKETATRTPETCHPASLNLPQKTHFTDSVIWPIDSSDVSPNHPEYQKFLKQRHNRRSTRPDYTTYISRKGYQVPEVSPKKLRLLDRTFVVEKSSKSADRYLKSDGLQLMATNSKLTDIPENLNDSVESFHTCRQNSQGSVDLVSLDPAEDQLASPFPSSASQMDEDCTITTCDLLTSNDEVPNSEAESISSQQLVPSSYSQDKFDMLCGTSKQKFLLPPIEQHFDKTRFQCFSCKVKIQLYEKTVLDFTTKDGDPIEVDLSTKDGGQNAIFV